MLLLYLKPNKMKKLELKHLAPYLPYELKLYWHPESSPVWHEMDMFNIHHVITYTKDFPEEKQWKPILRPLSDLTKEIEVNGEKLVPIEYLSKILGGKINSKDKRLVGKAKTALINEIKNGKIQYRLVKKLFKHHFDVFGLIEKGLAIDINTIENE